MKTILITGGAGFIGSNFVKYILSSGEYYPVILDKLTYAGNIDNLDKIDKDSFNLVEGDICNENTVSNLFKKYNFSGVFHFAAESHVDRSIVLESLFKPTS